MDDDTATVVELECLLLQSDVRGDRHRVRALLHADFVEYGASGRVWDRDSIVDALAARPDVSGEPADVRAEMLAPGVVLLTYRAMGPEPSVRSSTWLRTADGWRLRFHQGTPVPVENDAH